MLRDFSKLLVSMLLNSIRETYDDILRRETKEEEKKFACLFLSDSRTLGPLQEKNLVKNCD
jgi:hypothetical protein